MTRRDTFKALAASGAASALGATNDAGSAKLTSEVVRLKLRHTWTTTMSSSEFRDNLHLTYQRGGITSHGEGAPIVRYKETAVSGKQFVDSILPFLESADPLQFNKVLAEAFRKIEGQYATKAAIDEAIMDWVGQKWGIPLYQHFGLDPKDTPITTFSIGMDKPDVVRQKVAEAEPFPVLKVKVGLKTDEEMIESVRSATKKPLRVDANEGWTDKEEAVRKINWLETQGVEFIEQPMPAHMFEEVKWVRGKVHMPIIADEACLHPTDIPKLREAYDGVNIKLVKCGGILEAYRMISIARSLGMKVMLGCMIESSIGTTAAAHLSPLVDYADLDGNLLIANDPFHGVTVQNGKLILPTGPGLGLTKA